MSDAMSHAFRAAQNQESYDNRIKAIKESPIEDLCQTFNVEKSSNVLHLTTLFKDFSLEKNAYDKKWILKVRIPHAQSWMETFTHENLEEITTRALAFHAWGHTTIGKKAIEIYLD